MCEDQMGAQELSASFTHLFPKAFHLAVPNPFSIVSLATSD